MDLMSKKNMDNIIVAKEYPCNYCEHKFKEKSKLKAHIKRNHPKEIKCQVCDETFDKKNTSGTTPEES